MVERVISQLINKHAYPKELIITLAVIMVSIVGFIFLRAFRKEEIKKNAKS